MKVNIVKIPTSPISKYFVKKSFKTADIQTDEEIKLDLSKPSEHEDTAIYQDKLI